MSYPQLRLTWLKKISAEGEEPQWEETGTVISDSMSLKEDEALSDGQKIRSDSFNFNIVNFDKNGDGFGDLEYDFSNDDIINIEFGRDGGAYDFVMSGKINGYKQKITPDGRIISIKGINRTKTLLNSVFALDVENNKAPMMIANILKEANEFNETSGDRGNQVKFVYYNEKATPTPRYEDQDGNAANEADVTIQRKKSDGSTEFGTLGNFTSWFDPAYLQIQKLSGWEITGDGTYIFYVDAQNNFYWKSKTTTLAGTITEGTDFVNTEIVLDTDGVVNFFIIHCGNGPFGYGYLTYAFNDESIVDHGLNGKFLDRTSIAEQLMSLEKEKNGSSFTNDSYPFPTDAALAAGYTMSYADGTTGPRSYYKVGTTNYGPVGNSKGYSSTITVTTKALYDEALNEEAKARGRTEAAAILSILGEGIWAANVELNGLVTYNKGDKINFVVYSQDWPGGQEMRVHELSHDFNKGGWRTTLYLKQDEETI